MKNISLLFRGKTTENYYGQEPIIEKKVYCSAYTMARAIYLCYRPHSTATMKTLFASIIRVDKHIAWGICQAINQDGGRYFLLPVYKG